MHLGAQFLADPQDPRLEYVVHHANGTRATGYRDTIRAREMLAWSRWQLGWLDTSQIRCIIEPEATVSLSPIATPGDGIAMAAIPVSDREVIVIESRRQIGYDAGWDHRWASGARTTYPALAAEGLLIYTVDASRRSGRLPSRLAGYTGNAYPILTEGQSVTVGGYTITLKSATATEHIVAVTKAAES